MSDLLTADDRHDIAEGLRELAEFIETRPGVPMHRYSLPSVTVYSQWFDEDFDRSPAKIARAIGTADKSSYDGTFELERQFSGKVTYRFVFGKGEVCTAREVGVREVIERRPTDQARVDELTAELDALHENIVVDQVPVLEYDCPESLLGAA